jgi:phage baseplate assembly protein W
MSQPNPFTDSLSQGFSFPLGTVSAPGSTGNPDLDDNLGVDLIYVGSQGGLQVSEKGDYRLVRGYENVRRSIARRIMTNPGEYALDPTYGVGLGNFLKKPMTGHNLDLLRSRIQDQVTADQRVTRINRLDLTPTADQNAHPYLAIYIEYEVLGRQTAPFQQNFYARG